MLKDSLITRGDPVFLVLEANRRIKLPLKKAPVVVVFKLNELAGLENLGNIIITGTFSYENKTVVEGY